MLIDNKLLDDLESRARDVERLRMNYDMRNSESDTSQRMLNALEVGTVVPIHRHTMTSETQILLRGKVDVVCYDDNHHEIERWQLDCSNGVYGINIPAGMWHTVIALEASVIFEAKDGAYKVPFADDFL